MVPARLPASAAPAHRGLVLFEWVIIGIVIAVLAGATLGLGGLPAEVMVVCSAGVALAAVLALGRMLCEPSTRINVAALLPVPFLLYALASVWWLAPARWLAWSEWLLWFQAWLLFVVVLHTGRRASQTAAVVATLAALGLVCVVLAAYQRLVDHSWLMLGRTQAPQFLHRSSGSFGIPNSLACFLNLMVPCCLTLLLSRAARPSTKVIAAWLAGLFLVGVALAASRGGWIALALALLVWPVVAARRWKMKVVGLVVISAAILGGWWSIYHHSEETRERIQPLFEGRIELTRPIMWEAAAAIWRASPWLGSGAGSYDVVFERVRPPRFPDQPVWAHNDYLNLLSDYGLVGFGLWTTAALILALLAWKAVGHARRTARPANPIFERGKWKLGLWLGLLAFSLHLLVDFHFRIPALAFSVALSAGLLLRDTPSLQRHVRRISLLVPLAGLVIATIVVSVTVATPLYRSEARRQAAMRSLNRHARTGEGRIEELAPRARQLLAEAIAMDPLNGHAWSDLAYATLECRYAETLPAVALGRFAELAADRAIDLCPIVAEFWLRKGTALDLQGGRGEAESCYRRAIEIAPNSARAWYALAFHLHRFPDRTEESRHALETCLALDPYYRGAESLRQQLVPR